MLLSSDISLPCCSHARAHRPCSRRAFKMPATVVCSQLWRNLQTPNDMSRNFIWQECFPASGHGVALSHASAALSAHRSVQETVKCAFMTQVEYIVHDLTLARFSCSHDDSTPSRRFRTNATIKFCRTANRTRHLLRCRKTSKTWCLQYWLLRL